MNRISALIASTDFSSVFQAKFELILLCTLCHSIALLPSLPLEIYVNEGVIIKT